MGCKSSKAVIPPPTPQLRPQSQCHEPPAFPHDALCDVPPADMDSPPSTTIGDGIGMTKHLSFLVSGRLSDCTDAAPDEFFETTRVEKRNEPMPNANPLWLGSPIQLAPKPTVGICERCGMDSVVVQHWGILSPRSMTECPTCQWVDQQVVLASALHFKTALMDVRSPTTAQRCEVVSQWVYEPNAGSPLADLASSDFSASTAQSVVSL